MKQIELRSKPGMPSLRRALFSKKSPTLLESVAFQAFMMEYQLGTESLRRIIT